MPNAVSNYFTGSKKIFTPAILGLICLFAPAHAEARLGGMDSGGGDPLANEFLEVARAISNAIPTNDGSEFGINRQQFNDEVNLVAKSLEGHDPILVFPEGDTVVCFGAPKLGCVIDGKIHIARGGWQKSATDNEKFQVTAMELFMHMAIPMRYENAAVLAEKITPTTVFGAAFNPTLDCANGKRCLHGTWGEYDLTLEQTIADAPLYSAKLYDGSGETPTSAIEIGFTNHVCFVVHHFQQPDGMNIFSVGHLHGPSSMFLVASFGPKGDRTLPMIHFRIDRILSLEEGKAYAMAKRLLLNGEALRMRFDLSRHRITIEVLSGIDPDCI